jgi:hypothetical protein
MKIKRGLPFGRPLQFKSLARVHITLVKMMHGRYQKSFTLFPEAKPFYSIYSFFALASLLQEAADLPEQQEAFFPASAVFPAQHPAALLSQEAFFPSALFVAVFSFAAFFAAFPFVFKETFLTDLLPDFLLTVFSVVDFEDVVDASV